jgi:glycosyltransferase involved in cell wall biosynthesis
VIVAFIPAFNEETSVRNVILKASEYVDKVFVVDDGSCDKTAVISKGAGANVITHRKNSGYGAALRTCFETARKTGADIAVTLDADGQHNAEEIPLLLAPILGSKAHIVIGSRLMIAEQKIPLFRRAGMRILDFAMRIIGVKVLDCQSGFRAYSKEAISLINPVENGMCAGCEVLIEAWQNGLKIIEVPVGCFYTEHDSYRHQISHGLSVLVFLLKNTI